MRTTVEELQALLATCAPKAHVEFQIGIDGKGPMLMNGLSRVDKIGTSMVRVVVEKSA